MSEQSIHEWHDMHW